MVLLYKDFGMCNVMVDADNNHLVGIIDWAEADISLFGTKIHSLQQFMSKYRLSVGWIRYGAGGLEEATIQTIKSAMIVGLLLSHGFTSRLANMPKPEPIRDDESGAYEMLGLDRLLIVPATKLVDWL
ncbi:unnamed protein product [Penicillium palitans]